VHPKFQINRGERVVLPVDSMAGLLVLHHLARPGSCYSNFSTSLHGLKESIRLDFKARMRRGYRIVMFKRCNMLERGFDVHMAASFFLKIMYNILILKLENMISIAFGKYYVSRCILVLCSGYF
jgi:hypothetical protein